MKQGTLIILSGLPGSGKSTLAARLAARISATYLRIDTIEQALRDICGMANIEGEGYRLAYRIAQENLRMGNTVIADSVNPWPLTRNEWNAVAEDVGAAYVNVEIMCSNRDEHCKRVEHRKASDLSFKHPSWQEVASRDYRAWEGERIAVDTCAKTVDESFEELLTKLQIKPR